MNNIYMTKKIQFTIEVAEDVLEFLDLKLTLIKKYSRISVDIFVNAINSFTYVLPRTCFPKSSIENAPKDVALRSRKIFNSNGKFEECSVQYQTYLVVRDYKPCKFRKQFSDI